ncbi:hypothetical protein [Candidatus Uabimicrobium amorphum]|uniref:Lipoprotein n=1 Tax=Uabimicrobium amorphum TaxID=2596890 RepID=A0A5S9IKL3_UABAM|nr:hypothetical protein [Candidatus Uabimicrobium amorphum]BBM82315.1 hypothetical protein UABAM_00658 [Candidatus Uabimicrobium amorphum]
MSIRFMACICLCAFLMVGCDDVNKTSTNYAKTMVKTLDTAKKIQYTSGVQQQVRMYQVENNKWPNSLNDVKEVPQLPEGWEWKYDNKTGKVDIVKK